MSCVPGLVILLRPAPSDAACRESGALDSAVLAPDVNTLVQPPDRLPGANLAEIAANRIGELSVTNCRPERCRRREWFVASLALPFSSTAQHGGKKAD